MSGCIVGISKAVDYLTAVYVGLLDKLSESVILISLNAAVGMDKLCKPAVAVILVVGGTVVPVNYIFEPSGRVIRVSDYPAACIFQRNKISEGIIAVLNYISSEISIFY